MGNILHTIFISPLIFIFNCVLDITSQYIPESLSIIALSIVVQIFSIPLYKIAYKVEKKEKDLQKIITPELNVLKTLYKGEELFRRTDALYKKYKYNPLLAFRNSMSLFLIIPFFIAAYITLNNYAGFMGQSFFGLFNLDNPDRLLFGINVLPILMTIFNLIAIKYSDKNKRLFDKSNFVLLALALFFIIYLYNSSSALLLYWTMNNFIYMLKLIAKNKYGNK